MSTYERNKGNSLLGAVDAATYGDVEIPERGQMTAKPLPIVHILPDPAQPRRAIPAILMDEGIDNLQTLVANWHVLVESHLQTEVNVQQMITSGSDIDKPDSDLGYVLDFFELISLAASIYKEGLSNPITVVRYGSNERYMIETGERRWLAFSLLAYWCGAQFDRIPAVVRSGVVNVWRQAAENGARRPLNAIGMARQIALLIMDCYRTERGVDFGDYRQIVMPGECDRKYYAQVANGNAFRIPAGMASQFLDVTGLKSKNQISQYRALLEIPDEVWMEADRNNWPEFKIRERVQEIRVIEASRQRPAPPPRPFSDPIPARPKAEKIVDPDLREDDDAEDQVRLTIVNLKPENADDVSDGVTIPEWVNQLRVKDEVVYADTVYRVVTNEKKTILLLVMDPAPRTIEVDKASPLLRPYYPEDEPVVEPEAETSTDEPMSWAPLREDMRPEMVSLLRLLQRMGSSAEDSEDLLAVDWLLKVSREELRREIIKGEPAIYQVIDAFHRAHTNVCSLIDRTLKGDLTEMIDQMVQLALTIREDVRPDWKDIQ